jgi:hypothetical protein
LGENTWAAATCESVAITHPQAVHAAHLQCFCPVTLPLESREAALVNVQAGRAFMKNRVGPSRYFWENFIAPSEYLAYFEREV